MVSLALRRTVSLLKQLDVKRIVFVWKIFRCRKCLQQMYPDVGIFASNTVPLRNVALDESLIRFSFEIISVANTICSSYIRFVITLSTCRKYHSSSFTETNACLFSAAQTFPIKLCHVYTDARSFLAPMNLFASLEMRSLPLPFNLNTDYCQYCWHKVVKLGEKPVHQQTCRHK